jgi:hypothetical protein
LTFVAARHRARSVWSGQEWSLGDSNP